MIITREELRRTTVYWFDSLFFLIKCETKLETTTYIVFLNKEFAKDEVQLSNHFQLVSHLPFFVLILIRKQSVQHNDTKLDTYKLWK